jgi:hypothetical protein
MHAFTLAVKSEQVDQPTGKELDPAANLGKHLERDPLDIF